MAEVSALVAHLLRRAGLGVGAEERARFGGLSYTSAVDALTNYDVAKADVDGIIGTPGTVGITTRGQFQPNTVINDARQRWLARMVHTPAPLRERMALVWHHHFATAYSKIAGTVDATFATKMMDASPSTAGVRGQIELFREFALGNFRDLLIEVARDPAMLIWLDGRLNTRTRPQENFGRELMELFTVGVGNHTEEDVYAAARVFTGWNIQLSGARETPSSYYVFRYVAGDHDTAAKDFSFPIYAGGSRRIEARAAAGGLQDGIDLITALASHPETARRMARRLWAWFVSETEPPAEDFVGAIAKVYLDSDTNMKPVVRAVLLSRHFVDAGRRYHRYGWPVEYVVRSLKEAGYLGFSVDSAMTPLVNMGQQLYEPPDVNGWDLGAGWFTTGGMLARMNFASQLVTSQRFAIRDKARAHATSPEALVDFVVATLSLPPLDESVRATLVNYVNLGGAWTGSDAQLLNKAGGLFHLMVGSGEYQLV